MGRLGAYLAGLWLAASAGIATAADITLTGIVAAPRERGDPYELRLAAPRQFSGDADCGRQQKAEIALWDAPARLAPHVGRRVQVSGRLDCPRGGYVLRELRIGAAPAPASAPVAATPAAPGLALQQLLLCRTADGADSLLHLYEDGL